MDFYVYLPKAGDMCGSMSKNVTVLGIHDAGAALIRNGRVLAAVAEEIFVKIKHYSGRPENTIKQVFNILGISPSKVDIISIASLNRAYAPNAEEPFNLKVFELISPFFAPNSFSNFYVNIFSKQRSAKHLFKIFNELGFPEQAIWILDNSGLDGLAVGNYLILR
jgi:carbamoyltransferase